MDELPCAILIDDDDESLAPMALRLIRLGGDVLYTKWEDEVSLLAKQASGRVYAVVTSPAVAPTTLARVRSAVAPHASGREPALIAVGTRPDAEVAQALYAAGVSWALWEPFDDGDLRFVVNACAAVPEVVAPRREPRAPANQLCWLRVGSTRSFGVIYTLSAKGAYVETASPLPKDTVFTIEFDLDGRSVETEARVIYPVMPDQARKSLLPCGLGCVFLGLDPGVEAQIRDSVVRRAARYHVGPGAEGAA